VLRVEPRRSRPNGGVPPKQHMQPTGRNAAGARAGARSCGAAKETWVCAGADMRARSWRMC
jgi:hypothetical protein